MLHFDISSLRLLPKLSEGSKMYPEQVALMSSVGNGAVLLALGDQMQVRKLALCPCVVAWFDSVMGVSHLRASALVAGERGEGGICRGGSCLCLCWSPCPCLRLFVCLFVCMSVWICMSI